MLETTVIPIEYAEKDLAQAEELKEIIEKNPMLFQIFFSGYKKISFLDISEDEALSITSIQELKEKLRRVIPAYMTMLKESIYNASGEDIEIVFLKMFHMDIICSKEESSLEEEAEEISLNINTIYALIGMTYYTEEQLIDFIFNPTDEEKEKVFNYLNKKHRYNLINQLLQDEYQKLLDLEELEQDSYLRTHLEELLELSKIDISERARTKKGKATNIQKLSLTEFDDLCKEFFVQIDPSLNWLNLYKKLKENGGILFGEKFPDPYSNWGCLETSDNIVIYAPVEGTIRDFMYFVHEFAHYVTLFHKQREEIIPSALQEFPPIFFEKCAISYLIEKGYDEASIQSLEEERLEATLGNKSDISPSLRYLIQFINEGPITYSTEKEKMDRIRKAIPADLPAEIKKLLNSLMSTQDEDNVHTKIDAENAFLIEHPSCIFEEFPYIIGYDLAQRTLKRTQEDPATMFTVLSITENLAKETTAGVIQKLGLSQTEDSKGAAKPKQYRI